MGHLVGPAVCIENERGAERPGLAHGPQGNRRLAPARLRERKIEEIEHVGMHHRELAPELVRRVAIPIHLTVVIVSDSFREPGDKEIVLQSIVRPGSVWKWNSLLNALRNVADAVGRNDRVREKRTTRPVRIPRHRIVNPEVRV